jgi:transcriptional regulator GlxA family with amidase domain
MTYFMPKTSLEVFIMVHLTFLLDKGCLSSAICGSVDAFSIANIMWQFMGQDKESPLFKTTMTSVDGKIVMTNGGISLQPDCSIEDQKDMDIIVIPAFFPPFDLESERVETICNWLREQHAKGVSIASTCTGTFLLAKSGLLNGKIATTNWQFASKFKRMFPEVYLRVDRILTEDNGIYCTGAATAFMDICLYFIKKFGSEELARLCSKALLIAPDRQSQSPYIVYDFWKSHTDQAILKSQNWMETHYAGQVTIDQIADSAGISPRHFIRRFKKATGEPPIAYLQLLRIENAKRKLEISKDSVNEITWQVGYEDINSFRRLFRKHTGLSPKEYRNKFSLQPQSRIR